MTGPLRFAALVVAGISVGGTACRDAGGGSAGIVVVDDAGDTVRLPAPAGRIVFLKPVITELIFALEALAARAPRLIATVGSMSSELTRRPEWQTVAAVRAHRLLTLTDPALSHPTPRAPAAIAALHRQLNSALRVSQPKEVPQ